MNEKENERGWRNMKKMRTSENSEVVIEKEREG